MMRQGIESSNPLMPLCRACTDTSLMLYALSASSANGGMLSPLSGLCASLLW